LKKRPRQNLSDLTTKIQKVNERQKSQFSKTE
jgi:hypothetical protein